MLIGYARVSKADGSQSLDLQRDALRAEGIDDAPNLYHDFASGGRDDRPGLDSCLRATPCGRVGSRLGGDAPRTGRHRDPQGPAHRVGDQWFRNRMDANVPRLS